MTSKVVAELRTELQCVIDVSVNSTLNVEALNSMHLVLLERRRAKKDDIARVQLDKHSPASLILISEKWPKTKLRAMFPYRPTV